MYVLLSVIHCHTSADASVESLLTRIRRARDRLSGVHASHAGRTLPRAINGGHILWRLAFLTEGDCAACLASDTWQQELASPLRDQGLDQIGYYSTFLNAKPARDRPGIWRCLALAVEPGADRKSVRQMENELLLMPKFVSSIGSWSLGRVAVSRGARVWTHVWEQEFDGVEGLEGEYMLHPIHWGLVDRWFDPECPERIVDPHLVHAAIPIDGPVIS